MRLKSTGLGNTELEAKIVNVKRVDDLVIFYADVIKPVKWHTKMAFQVKDLRTIVREVLKPNSLRYILKALLFRPKNVKRTETF